MNEIKIQVPEGYEGIDMEASNLAEGKIVFKKKEDTPWKDSTHRISGYYTAGLSIYSANGNNTDPVMADLFATKKQAKSSQAMAQLSQIMQNDPRFGGPIPTNEWNTESDWKYTIRRIGDKLSVDCWTTHYHFLAFRTAKQRDLFLKENEKLIREYFMMD